MPKTETETPKMKPRPIVRLGIFLISHSLLVCVVCCTAGVLALLLLPLLAKNTYISENALMPGSASSMISNRDISEANRLASDLSGLNFEPQDAAALESRGILTKYMSDLGAEVCYHKFHHKPNQFHPLHFFSSPDSTSSVDNFSCSAQGVNTVGIIRAPRGDGKEAYCFGDTLQYFPLLSRVTWLAKDIIWLVADSQYGEYAPVEAWLRDYHTPVFTGLGALNADTCIKIDDLYALEQKPIAQTKISDGFRRAGTMAAALIFKVADRNELLEDTLNIYAEASNGQMPNLDLINIVNYLAVHRQGLRVKVEKVLALLDSRWLEILGEIFEVLGKVARSLNPGWKFGISAADYVEGSATLASSLYNQALGIPTGPHGAFRDFQVDAITLEISPKVSSHNKARHNEFLLRGGRLVEGVVRSINNLLEKFHQSFFLYMLTSPSKFVSVGVYMIAFALLVAPLPLVAASLYADANQLDLGVKNTKSTTTAPDELDITFRSWKWLYAAKEVFLVHVWGAAVSLLPYFICQIPNCSPTSSSVIWVSLSMLGLLILYLIVGSPSTHVSISQHDEKGEWAILKSVTISAVFIGLLLMSVVNFATAEIGALLLVPMCLMAQPLKLDMKAGKFRSFFRVICNMVLGFVAFPPAAYFVAKTLFEGSDSINMGDFWNWMESLWAWNSATYIYIGMVHLPCWALCLHILLHSC
uniref:Glycosylphosphatidylinositol anchor attachment 1 protein n=1 Tax=Salix viminalis TaxID=40686 RepID=A0A6N2M771_SALVM